MLIYFATALVSVAGFAHLSLIPEHSEIPVVGIFFAFLGITQLAMAGLIFTRKSIAMYAAMASATVGVIALYFVTRIIPTPFSHHAEPEPVEPIGLLVKSFEILFVGLLAFIAIADKHNLSKGVTYIESNDRDHVTRRNGRGLIRNVYIAAGILILGFIAGLITAQSGILQQLPKAGLPVVSATPVTEYTLVVEEKNIQVASDVTWKAWTYNGTVPGPTLKVKLGETFRVRLINKHNLIHSFHTHLLPYEFKYDGSQANLITGIGSKSMVPPNEEYVYEFTPSRAGIFYYHCHSADGEGNTILTHILQGLYGAIIVEDPEGPKASKEFVVFMAEIGRRLEGEGTKPFYVMNGMGVPGGEKALETIFKQKGLAGVAEQFNKTLPVFKVKVGETVRMHIINIGDLIHSFHLHGQSHLSEQQVPARHAPAHVVPLVPGQAETLIFTPIYDGVWLFHCHVVSHADGGMIGVLITET